MRNKVLILTISILFIFSVGIYLGSYFKQKDIHNYERSLNRELKSSIDLGIESNKVMSDFIFQNSIDKEEILVIQYNALKAKTEKQRAIYRDELYKKLSPIYDKLSKLGYKQLHFHLPDTTTFLRFHKPNKFGDSLKGVRYSIETVNKHKKFTYGFEEGRIFNGFRYVYPLFYKQEHIGSVEISTSFSKLHTELSILEDNSHYYMILSKDIVDKKLFENEQKNYEESFISKDFLHEINKFSNARMVLEDNSHKHIKDDFINATKTFKEDKNTIHRLLAYETFTQKIKVADVDSTLSFMPLKNIEGKNVGYIIKYQKTNKLYEDIYNDFYIRVMILTAFMILIYITFLKMLLINTRLEKSEQSNKKYLNIIDKYVMTSSTDVDGVIIDVSQRFCDNVGFSKNQLIGHTHNILRHPDSIKEQHQELWATIKSAKEYKGIIKNISKDGKTYWVDTVISPILDDENNIIKYTEVGYDITAQMQDNNLAQEMKAILDFTPNMVFIVDDNDITFCNNSFLKFFELIDLEDFNNKKAYIGELFLSGEYFTKDDFEDTSKWVSKLVEITSCKKLISIASYMDKTENIFSVEISELATKNNRYLISLSNITGMVQESSKFEHQANHDALTSIHNKNYFNTRLDHELSLVKRYHHPSSLLIFDIDNFKQVNDTYGRIIGDNVLIKLSQTIKEHIRENDIFARWGGEEFVIVSTHTPINQMMIFAEKLRKVVESTSFEDVKNITCSFGITELMHNDTCDSIIVRADKALYRAKAYGRNRVEVEKIV